MTRQDRNRWTEANRRFLVEEFGRLAALLEGEPGKDAVDAAEERITAVREELSEGPPAVDVLSETLGLSGFERDLLVLVAGVEMDPALARRCGEAMETPERPWATFGLALSALPGGHWSALNPTGPLRHWRLLTVGSEEATLSSACLRIDERILHYLVGIQYVDARLQPLLHPVHPPAVLSGRQESIGRRILEEVRRKESPPSLISLSGDDPDGQEDVAATVSRALDAALYRMDATDIPTDLSELETLAILWDREAALSGRTILLREADEASSRATRRFIQRMGSLCFRMGPVPSLGLGREVRFEVNRPEAPEQRDLWRAALGPAAERLNGALDRISSQYRLSTRSIMEAAQRMAPDSESNASASVAWNRIVRPDGSGLTSLAQRIDARAGWDDLVLPQAQKETLREIALQVRHRIRVYHDWGFAARSSRGLGIGALFCGESGTGKTMAAEVLAGELELDLYRIDLSAVVSKYIGETEKNLRKVFDFAEEEGAILLFDEADALFGKRSEVKDSHDRYANIEISYLLQRMEAYRGLAILTTNLKEALDTAFHRRLRFVVQFPFPDIGEREAIWRGIFPVETPLQEIDFEKLARLNVAGGSIRNIALHAAFSAASESSPVTMRHILRAARADAGKRERALTDAEIRGWA